jgi:hypothetical protein
MMAARDEFSAKIKRILASRVGYRCSNPECQRATIGPASDGDESMNVGVAAHITAAAPGGPRYDQGLTAEERKSAANGIWLCQGCGKLIDSDEKRFTSDLIRKWKKDAIDSAFKAIATSQQPAHTPIIIRLDDADREFLRSLALPAEDDVDAVMARMLRAGAEDVVAFCSMREWPPHAIELSLTVDPASKPSAASLAGIASGISVPDGMSIVSDPGTGKTTTLVQLAKLVLRVGQFLPVVVPLGEWSDRDDDFFDFVKRRYAFRAFRREHFMQLAYHGRLVLLLDGWNELDPSSQTRALRDLRALRRDYPILNVMVGTRRHALPVTGVVVGIEPLSHDQQRELAKALRGSEGEALVDQAWRTPGVRELMGIPLYLSALVTSATGAAFPQTKEEVLRMFVARHEGALEQAATLRKELLGFHTNMLVGLAVEANRTSNTAISDTNARRVITEIEAGLATQGQMTVAPQPTAVLDVLTGGHVLIRSSSGASAVSFQHQLFQEWYASFEVERVMQQAAQGNAAAFQSLRHDMLNRVGWEESILFACERLSRSSAHDIRTVGAAIHEALGIDPMLAGEMIFRAAPEVWPLIQDEVIGFAKRWHQPGRVDRATRFMITTGRPEFAEFIWPLVAKKENQVHIDVLRAAERFRPSVLGADAPRRLAELPDDVRKDVLAEIASNSGFEGMELAAGLAKTDPNPDVVVDIIQAVQFRRGDRHVAEILKTVPTEVWERIARESYPDNLADREQNARLLAMREAEGARQTDPIRKIGWLLEHGRGDPRTAGTIVGLVASASFPINIDHGRTALHRAIEAFPREIANALVARLAARLEVPYGSKDYLTGVDTIDDGPVAAAVLDPATPERVARAAIAVIGPKTVGTLIDEFLALDARLRAADQQASEAERNEYRRLIDNIAAARPASFAEAFIARAITNDPVKIGELADLFARHGRSDGERVIGLRETDRDRLAAIVSGWIDVLLSSPPANRHQMSNVARVVQRLGQPQLVEGLQRMLERDLDDWAKAREAHFKAGSGGALTPDVTYSHKLEYQRAFAELGGERAVAMMRSYLSYMRFGLDAASVLGDIWRRAHPSGKERQFASWHDYSEVQLRRAQRQDRDHPPETSDDAEAIFAVVRVLGRPDKEDSAQRHAIALAQVALGMPHGCKRAEIDQLLALPQPYTIKQGLLRAAAMAGEEIPADALLAAVQELLEVAQKERWRLDENRGELRGWIELFVFSDRPLAVLEALELIPANHREPWQLDQLLSALANSPSDGALGTLEALATREPRLLERHEWLTPGNPECRAEGSRPSLLWQSVRPGWMASRAATRNICEQISCNPCGNARALPDDSRWRTKGNRSACAHRDG